MSTILLADDSPHGLRMGERILRDEGFQVALAIDGDETLIKVRECDPDVVIVDLFLKGRSGSELCGLIKRERPYTRVILTAGLLETFDHAAVLESGCDALLRKPFEASVMLAAVREQLAAARESRRVAGATLELSAAEVRERVARAIEAELPRFIDEVTRRVLAESGLKPPN